MTAKKKAPSSPKSKAPKTKQSGTKQSAKKESVPKIASKKTPARSKKAVVNKKTATPKVTKVTKKLPSPAKKATKLPTKAKKPVKKATKPAPKKPVKAKSAPKKAGTQTTTTSTITKVKEIVSKSLGKPQKEDTKVESNFFSFDDVLSFLQSKKKAKNQKKSSPKSNGTQVSKPQKVAVKKKNKIKKLTTASIDDILGFGAPVSGVYRPVRDESKVPKQWKPFYNSLMSLRTALKGSLGERSSETIGASARESGELSINSSDAGTETFDRDLALSMVANDQEALEEIEDAIDRIFDGTYGICLETKKPINKNRLKAVPFTRFSVEGQSQFERGKIKEKDFGSGSFATLADSTMGEEE